jgi:hypothetical protein
MKEKPPAAEPEKPVGLVCRACGCRHFEVGWTRQRSGGRILRSRICRNCGTAKHTVEREAGT